MGEVEVRPARADDRLAVLELLELDLDLPTAPSGD
jgi:hypothetical protein